MNNRYEHLLNKYRHRFIDEKIKDIDVNFPEGPYLIRIDKEKKIKMNTLKNSIPFHKSHLTRAINRLVEKGLIRKDTDPEDQRGFIVSITDEGERIASKAISVFDEWEQLVRSVITEEEQNTLSRIQEKMVRKVAEYFKEELPDEKNL